MEAQNNVTQFGECRCCLTKGNHRDLYKEYYLNGQREIFMDVFMECFNLFLSTDPRLSPQICSKCIRRLRDAQSFRQLVLDSEKHLLEAFGHNNDTEFVNVVFDPLVHDSAELKAEVKSESLESLSLEFNDDHAYVTDLSTVESDLVPGERELLDRFRVVKMLPTRESLVDTCPIFCGHLEMLKGKIIEASAIEKPVKSPKSRKSKKWIRNNVVSEKMAQALNATTIIENSNATVFKSKMRSGFPCFYCREIFDNPKELRGHQRNHPKSSLFKLITKYTVDALIVYADITDLKCTICNEDTPSIKDLKEHLVTAHNKKIYDNVTDKVIPFKLGDKESNFDCLICGLKFETFGAIDKHMNAHYRNYVCEECGRGFITKHRLKVHMYMLHPKSSIISCDTCKKTFLNRHKYKIHYESVHKKLKKMKCPKCSDKFIDYFSRQRHMEEKHGVEPILYKCTECDRSFNRKYSLTCHFRRRHLANKDVQCELCPFMCFSKSELTDHMFKHGVEKSFECTICKKAFMRKKSLTVHLRVHSNEFRYSCHLCGETFVQNWSLKSHLKSHSMEYEDL